MTHIARIAAIVPMRHHSERVPNKNYAHFRGRPLYTHILDTLARCRAVTQIVVDTDSQTITDQLRRERPGVTVLNRPEHLRDGGIPMNRVLLHTVDQLQADLFLQTHSTNPLLRAVTIDRAIDTFLSARAGHDSLFGVTRWQTRLYDHLGRPMNHDPAVLARTQDLPPVFEENSNLYLFDAPTLRRTGRRIGERPLLFEIDRLESIDIDDMTGWKLAEAVAASGIVETLP
jgi:CMP-N-acetylneuraminic acid synthetase